MPGVFPGYLIICDDAIYDDDVHDDDDHDDAHDYIHGGDDDTHDDIYGRDERKHSTAVLEKVRID